MQFEFNYYDDIHLEKQRKYLQREAKKNQVIYERLEEMGITIDRQLERRKRFKSITVDIQQGIGTKTYYYNEGSPEGLKIVTFIPIESNHMSLEVSVGYQYHYD